MPVTAPRPKVKVAAPVLYAAGIVPALVGLLFAMTFIEYFWGFNRFNTIYANGDLGGAVSVALIGGLVFGPLVLGLLRLERSTWPGGLDHLRHCALLYPLCASLLVVLLATYEANMNAPGGPAGGYVAAAGLFLISVWAVVVDALVILIKRRSSLTNHRSTT